MLDPKKKKIPEASHSCDGLASTLTWINFSRLLLLLPPECDVLSSEGVKVLLADCGVQ